MSDELDQARASIEHLRGDVAKLRAERDRAQADCEMHMQHRMEIERLLDEELGPEVEDGADAGFVADVALALQRRKVERDTARAELTALRASAVVPPVGGWEHLVWHAVYNGDPYANVVALIKSWRPATVEAAPTAGIALADELWPPAAQPDREKLVRLSAVALNGHVARNAMPRWDTTAERVVDALLARYDIRERGETG